ncbi:hypothetical protein [Xenorhabdus siamensis]|uniref:hypothetical protein n=1 Tax=Xenorhabdus siamensis TaxID=3136254 RepID=UPI0030F430E4
MKIKDFIFNTEFKKLLKETKSLEAKLKDSDPELENVALDDQSYKEYFDFPARLKIVLVFLFIIFVHLSFSSVLPKLYLIF